MNYDQQDNITNEEIEALEKQPITNIKWVRSDRVIANNYNMNAVAPTEMKLLATSILQDGFTMPVVTMYDKENDRYIIVDGFHRTSTIKNNEDVGKMTMNFVPIVVIDKPIEERVASTVRHNRARGKHSVEGMSNAVFMMLEEGLSDIEICSKLGMEAEELLKLKHITGFSKLFEGIEYQKAWITRRQIKIKQEENQCNM
jgi:ParB-like chromosome segregation protein Spo0J